MGPLFWKVSELLFPVTMSLVQNSAKVMASSAINVNHYIAKVLLSYINFFKQLKF